MTDIDRLRRIFGEDVRWLVDRARTRIERDQPLTGTVTYASPTPAQRHAVERLLGRSPGRGASINVSLDEVDRIVRRSGLHDDGLVGVVAVLRGDVVPTAVAAAQRRAAWDAALSPVAAIAATRPELGAWYDDPRTRGLIQRLLRDPPAAAPIAAKLAEVLAALPCDGVPMSRFAATVAGGAHALDRSTTLATLAESAIRTAWASELGTGLGPAQRRRGLWDAVGVLLDELSSTVLCLNIAARPGSRLYRFTEPAREAGEPLILTLRQVAREPMAFVPGGSVYVCENPAVVAVAADTLGPVCPPLVCVNGQPSVAAVRLLVGLYESGMRLRYHGDFDWGGIRIANLLYSRVPWRPWRYDTASYRQAVGRGRAPLRGGQVTAHWDDQLSGAMADSGVIVEEELLLDDLVADLATDYRG